MAARSKTQKLPKLKLSTTLGYSVVDLKGNLLFSSEDLLSCMASLREHAKGRVYRNVDSAMLAFMTGAGY